MLDKRVKDLLEEMISESVYDGRQDHYLIKEAEAILDNEEKQPIFEAFKYILTDYDKLDKLTEIVNAKDKKAFIQTYAYNDDIAKYINKYWDRMETLFSMLSDIIKVCELTDGDIKRETLEELTTEGVKAQINLEHEEGNKYAKTIFKG